MRHSNWALVAIAMLVIGLSTTTTNVFAVDSSPVTKYPTAFSGTSWFGAISDLDDQDSDCIGTTTGSSSLVLTGFGFDLPPTAHNIVAEATVRLDTQAPTFGNFVIDVEFELYSDGDLLGTSSSFPEDLTAFCSPLGAPFTDTEMVTVPITLAQASDLEIHVTRTSGDDVEVNEVFITLTFDTCEEGEELIEDECVAICEPNEEFNPETEECVGKNTDDDDHIWDTRPTFGVSPVNQNVLVVKCGFGMDQSCWDMTNQWHTDFEKVVINIGDTHDFQLNIMAQQRLKISGFCLVPAVGNMEGELCFEMSFDGNGVPTGTKITQKEGLVDESLITFESSRDGAFYNMKVKNVKFLDKPFFEVIGMYAIDWQPLGTQTFANEGLGVIGDPLTEQPIIQIASHTKSKSGDSGMMTLTRVDKFENVWTTDEGILYTFNSYGTPEKLSPDVAKRITDETQMVMTRTNSNFNLIVDWSTDQAEQKMKEMYPNLFKEQSFAEINNIKTITSDYKDTKKILADSLFN